MATGHPEPFEREPLSQNGYWPSRAKITTWTLRAIPEPFEHRSSHSSHSSHSKIRHAEELSERESARHICVEAVGSGSVPPLWWVGSLKAVGSRSPPRYDGFPPWFAPLRGRSRDLLPRHLALCASRFDTVACTSTAAPQSTGGRGGQAPQAFHGGGGGPIPITTRGGTENPPHTHYCLGGDREPAPIYVKELFLLDARMSRMALFLSRVVQMVERLEWFEWCSNGSDVRTTRMARMAVHMYPDLQLVMKKKMHNNKTYNDTWAWTPNSDKI